MNTENDIIESKIDALTQTIGCDTLKTHVANFFKNSKLVSYQEEKDGELYDFIMSWVSKMEPLEIFDNLESRFWNSHKIDPESQSKVKNALGVQAAQYCLYALYPDITPDIIENFNRLKKISILVQKLKNLLPEPNDELFSLLKCIDSIENRDLQSKNVDVFFSSLNLHLDALSDIYSRISETGFGKLTKIGSKSPQGNLALRTWVISSHIIWEEILERSFQYDGLRGVSGPAKFANFAFDAILPLHPEIEYSQIEYAVRAFRHKQIQDRSKSNLETNKKIKM